jgi:hypothetical protein
MSTRLSILNKRLVKVEQQVAHIARREQLADCKCFPPGPNGISLPWFIVKKAEEFEADMNLRCPVHGFRRLGALMIVQIVGRKGEISEEYTRRMELVTEYKRRLSEAVKSNPELEDDRNEF